VGADQKQHLELTRDLAQRFNQRYSETFSIPEPYIPNIGARVMSLQDPTKKMSKSDGNADNYVALLDPADVIRRKIKRAVTDSGREIRYDESRPGLANLMNMYSALSGQSIKDVEVAFEGKLYGQLKSELADLMVAALEPVRAKYEDIMSDKTYLGVLLARGAEQCRRKAQKTLAKVYRKVGFVPPVRSSG
jgi:tryptophanyl-tRNA synthetase